MTLGFLTDGNPQDVTFARQEGFDCLELALFGDTPLFTDNAALISALQAEAIPVAAVSLFGQNYSDPEHGQENINRLRRVIGLAGILRARHIVFGTGSTPPGDADADKVKNAVEMLRPHIEFAQGLGLKVAFYNCHWENVVDRPSAWEIALPLLPGVGVKFDPSHPLQARRDWKAELLAAGPHLLHAHAKDVLEVGGRFVADPNPGFGDIRWESFFGILNHVGYDGAVCIEPHFALYTGPRRHEFLRASGRYLRQFLP